MKTIAVGMACALLSACGSSGGGGAPATGGGVVGGGPGAGGSGVGGRGVYTAPACQNPMGAVMGTVNFPNPLISVGKRVTASMGVTNPMKAVDGLYSHNGTFLPAPSATAPGWVAIELGAGPTRLYLSWADISYTDYNTSGTAPGAYTIATSGDSTDGQDGTWDTVVTVPDNAVRERAHAFAFDGKSWVKIVVTSASNPSPLLPGVSFDEIEVHDISADGTMPPSDSWFFMGDSITVNAFRRQFGAASSFDGFVHARNARYTPSLIDGGIGGELSNMGLGHLATWLALNPDVRHLGIMYGTNDSFGEHPVASTQFEANMRSIVQMVLAANKVPILARLPYSVVAPTTLPGFNGVIDAISMENNLPCGPDLYAWFRDHPEEVTMDGVHPTEVGYVSINRLWAEAMRVLYPIVLP